MAFCDKNFSENVAFLYDIAIIEVIAKPQDFEVVLDRSSVIGG